MAECAPLVTGTALSVTMLCCYLPLVIFSTVWFVLGGAVQVDPFKHRLKVP